MNINFSLILDPLSIFFLITIMTISIPSFIYSFGYLKGHYSHKKIIYGTVLFIMFVLSMLAVVTVGNAFTFLIVWELMSLVSYFLVIFDSENERSITAGTIYVVMTHIGTAFLIAAILLMYKYCGSFDLSVIKASLLTMPVNEKSIIFLLLLIGFGTKAGIVPLHIWLPYAHPQAPSHISSMMSGVMIKTAVYGIIRFVIITLGIGPVWWGELIMVFACISCIVGILYALMEKDIKILLAYSSVENMGIILLGVGASMLFASLGMGLLSVLALCAGLYHLINHAVFKSLLFLGAGSVYNATGTRNIEKLGGLIKKMPWTSSFFLIGSMSISALPPLNGFVSEWLTLIVLFLGALAVPGGLKVFFAVSAGALALTGGLAAACFVKAFGITFLARPRSEKAASAHEATLGMNIGMGLLALLTIILGLGAAVITGILIKVAAFSTGINASSLLPSMDSFILNVGGSIKLSTPIIALMLMAILCSSYILVRAAFGRKKVTVGATWDCGYYALTPRNEYTATGFSKPLRIAFSFFLMPVRKIQKLKDSAYHVRSLIYETSATKIFRDLFLKDFVSGIFNTGKLMRGIQTGSIQLYLGYIVMTVLVLLVIAGRH